MMKAVLWEVSRLACVRFLVERRGAAVNQRDRVRGWTPLLRCAHMAHHTHAPFLGVFSYLLAAGADPALTGAGLSDPTTGDPGPQMTVLEAAVQQGRGWQAGQVRARLAALIQQHDHVSKQPATTYTGGDIGPLAAKVVAAWERRAPVVPPANWRPPPPAGYADAQGMRLAAREPWRPAGQSDGSCTLRAMTEAELRRQSQLAAEASARPPVQAH
ncbi:hypothetical protein WJX81_007292 [Elliptochloris bilobata]|uniref:Uncharacterized protein n=1 Tax=Elliptochloris bilobata TaxID=381761 RepID=A0AAW1QMI5_9CHLO